MRPRAPTCVRARVRACVSSFGCCRRLPFFASADRQKKNGRQQQQKTEKDSLFSAPHKRNGTARATRHMVHIPRGFKAALGPFPGAAATANATRSTRVYMGCLLLRRAGFLDGQAGGEG